LSLDELLAAARQQKPPGTNQRLKLPRNSIMAAFADGHVSDIGAAGKKKDYEALITISGNEQVIASSLPSLRRRRTVATNRAIPGAVFVLLSIAPAIWIKRFSIV
jgi:prepilin-type processing-associated H-X9-DG protein